MDFETWKTLNGIIPKHVYFDIKSKEKTTGKVGEKYKLSGHPLLEAGFFPFFVLTSGKDTHPQILTICVCSHEWEQKTHPRFLNGKSYICIKAHETIPQKELIIKITKTGFERVAKIPDQRFVELENLRQVLRTKSVGISQQKQQEIDATFGTSNIAKEIIKSWQLS